MDQGETIPAFPNASRRYPLLVIAGIASGALSSLVILYIIFLSYADIQLRGYTKDLLDKTIDIFIEGAALLEVLDSSV